jgi:predicted amidohydrolase
MTTSEPAPKANDAALRPSTADVIGVAVIQFAPGADTAANLATIERLASIAQSRGARLVVAPEYSSYFTPTMDSGWLANAQPIDGEFASALGALAQKLGIHIVAGMLESTDDPARFSNTLIAIDQGGNRVATYRKMHLYDAFGHRESDFVVAGPIAAPETFAVGGLTVGMQTCYDIRFPEVTRRLVDAGADLVVVPSEWVRGPLKEHHWRVLLTARAIENTVFVAAADHAPPIGVGNSMVLDPMGVELATIGDIEDVAVAHLEVSRIHAVRAVNPALALRRFGVTPI